MDLYERVQEEYRRHRGEKTVYGTSAEGRPLFAMHIGSLAGPQGISQYAIHGREWATGLIGLYHVQRGVPCGGIWILPLSNPDGAMLSLEGAGSVSRERRNFLTDVNGGTDFSLWKANARAVDLNVNFDARWGTGARNVRTPAPENYIGPTPRSEPETRALIAFTERIRPDFTVSWHTKGEEIYWEFHQPLAARPRDRRLASALSKSTGYPLKRVRNSAGGYKDWCISALGIPAFTVEAGADRLSHPLTEEALPALLPRTLDALCDLVRAAVRFGK